jgi:hypothetical protein
MKFPRSPQSLDTVPALLRPGEGVLVPEATQMLGGRRGINFLNRKAEAARMPRHFARGGVAELTDPKFIEALYRKNQSLGNERDFDPETEIKYQFRDKLASPRGPQHFAGGGVADPESLMTPPPQNIPPGFFYDNNGNLVNADSLGHGGAIPDPNVNGSTDPNVQYRNNPGIDPALLGQGSLPPEAYGSDGSYFHIGGSGRGYGGGNPYGLGGRRGEHNAGQFNVQLDNFRRFKHQGGDPDMGFREFSARHGGMDMGDMDRGDRPGFADLTGGLPQGNIGGDRITGWMDETGVHVNADRGGYGGTGGVPNTSGVGSLDNPSFTGGSVFGTSSNQPTGFDAQGNPVYGGQPGGFNIPGGIGLGGLGGSANARGEQVPFWSRMQMGQARNASNIGGGGAIAQLAASMGTPWHPLAAVSGGGGGGGGGGGQNNEQRFGPNGRRMSSV